MPEYWQRMLCYLNYSFSNLVTLYFSQFQKSVVKSGYGVRPSLPVAWQLPGILKIFRRQIMIWKEGFSLYSMVYYSIPYCCPQWYLKRQLTLLVIHLWNLSYCTTGWVDFRLLRFSKLYSNNFKNQFDVFAISSSI